jgi:hypothetical protein
MSMWTKFGTGLSYAEWPNVVEALLDCNGSSPVADVYGGRDKICWNKLNCALSAADASQAAQYSSAATILGLVAMPLFCGFVRWLDGLMGVASYGAVDACDELGRAAADSYEVSAVGVFAVAL